MSPDVNEHISIVFQPIMKHCFVKLSSEPVGWEQRYTWLGQENVRVFSYECKQCKARIRHDGRAKIVIKDWEKQGIKACEIELITAVLSD